MKSARRPTKHPIAQFLQDNLGVYTNPFGVQSFLLEDGTFSIAAKYPAVFADPGFTMEVCMENITVDEFSKLSGIATVEQLHFVSPHLLLELYERGAAILSVLYEIEDNCWELVFQKKDGRVHVKDEDEETAWVSKKKLVRAADYLRYMLNYSKKH